MTPTLGLKLWWKRGIVSYKIIPFLFLHGSSCPALWQHQRHHGSALRRSLVWFSSRRGGCPVPCALACEGTWLRPWRIHLIGIYVEEPYCRGAVELLTAAPATKNKASSPPLIVNIRQKILKAKLALDNYETSSAKRAKDLFRCRSLIFSMWNGNCCIIWNITRRESILLF